LPFLSLNTGELKNEYESAQKKANRLSLLAEVGSAESVRISLSLFTHPTSAFLLFVLLPDILTDTDMLAPMLLVESQSGRSRCRGISSPRPTGGGSSEEQGVGRGGEGEAA
jgi:hypothetical protein